MSDEYPRLVSPIPTDLEAAHKNALPGMWVSQKRVKAWPWRDAGHLLLKVTQRFPDPTKVKVVLPYTLWEVAPDQFQWRQKDLPGPRPLYGLDRLAARPDTPAMVHEGEKACDAAGELFPEYVHVTSGNANSARNADWTPLQGRLVTIWPDRDEPGGKYAQHVQECLQGIAICIRTVQVPDEFPEKWDLADPCPAGWSAEQLKDLIEAAMNPQVPHSVAEVATVAVAGNDQTALGGWSEPQSLHAGDEHERYPTDALPDSFRHAVEEVQEFVQAPMPLVASSALTAASAAVQGLVDIARDNKLTGPVNLFFLTIADSGERKSSCDGYFTRALRDYEAQQAEAMAPAVKAYTAAMEAWTSKVAGVKDGIRKATREAEPTDEYEQKLEGLELAKPQAPRVPRLIYGDATPEALRFGLASQWPSGAVVSAEAGIVFGAHGMGSDSIMRNLSTLNQLWDGGEIPTDRRSKESFTVRGARLTVGLQVQEPTLREFMEKSGVLARGSGFLARFLIACPESTQGTRMFREASVAWPHLGTFNRRVIELLNLPLDMTPAGALNPTLLRFSPAGKQAWIEFHDRIERQLGVGRSLQDVRDVASKVADNASRLAAIFHVFEHGYESPVDEDCFLRGARIAEWHLQEARRFFGEMTLPVELIASARLDAWLLAKCRYEGISEISTRTAQQFGPIRSKIALENAVQELADLDRLLVLKDKKRKIIRLNPALLLGLATATVATVATHGAVCEALVGNSSKSSNCSDSTPSKPLRRLAI